MNPIKIALIIVFVLLVVCGYLFIPFQPGSGYSLSVYGNQPMPWGQGNIPLYNWIWILGIRLSLFVDAILMLIILKMDERKWSLIALILVLQITRCIDVVQLILNGDVADETGAYEYIINAIFFILLLFTLDLKFFRKNKYDEVNTQEPIIVVQTPNLNWFGKLIPGKKIKIHSNVADLTLNENDLEIINKLNEHKNGKQLERIYTQALKIKQSSSDQEKDTAFNNFTIEFEKLLKD